MSKQDPVTETIHGIEVTDPYRWLEDSDDPEVQAWIKEQNQLVDQDLKNNEVFNTFSDELVENFSVVNFSTPYVVNDRYFYQERQPEEDQWILYYKDGMEGEPVVIFDPNGQKEGNTVTIDRWEVSHSGRFIVYGVSEDGDEMATLFIKDIETGKSLKETIPHCRYASVAWLSDDSGFYYTRHPRPGTVPEDELHMHSKVYLHKLGDDPAEDELIFGEDRPKDDMISIDLSPDDKYLGIRVSQNWTEGDIFIYDTDSKETTQVVSGNGYYAGIYFLADKALMYTNYQADNCRVLSASYADLFDPIDEWDEFIPEAEHKLESFSATADEVLAHYLANAASEVVIFDHAGEREGELPLPEYANVLGIVTNREESEFFYSVNSFIEPRTTYRFDPGSTDYDTYRQEENPLNPADYSVKQEWYQSADGTKVPMFIVHRKDIKLDGSNPTILYSYGGFGASLTPGFARNRIPWLERGGIYVLANIRGGGEFGEEWHKSAMKAGKQNSFDDFIAAAEYLVDKKYTSSEHLGIVGGSNGGLLVAAAGVQRPDLFQAVCSLVPLTDMLRFHRFGMAARWVHEYGDPEHPEEFKHILKWSPYHNIKAGQEYPHFLVTTAEKDTRVHPLHARKLAARLQAESSESDTYLFTETKAGHGPGTPIHKIVESQAIKYAFFAQQLGMRM